MSVVITQTPLTLKEAEAILWGCGQITHWSGKYTGTINPREPMTVLLHGLWARDKIMEAVAELENACYNKLLVTPLTKAEMAVLKAVIENSSWIETYRTHEPTAHVPALISEALRTLRRLARKLEPLGVEINHLPND